MRLHHRAPMLAATAALLAASAPAANAVTNRTPAPGAVEAQATAQHHSAALSAQGAIELGVAAGVGLVVVGGGLTVTSRRPQRPGGTTRAAKGA